MKKAKILGTGLSGLVGSRIVKLLADDFEFVNLDLKSGVDITNFDQVFDVFKDHQDAVGVIHLAAVTDVSRADRERDNKQGLVYKVNVAGTKNIAKAAGHFKKYLFHVSTDFVFDGRKKTPYTEEDQPNPIEWYGQTKLWAEEAVAKELDNYFIGRLAFPINADEPSGRQDFLHKVLSWLRNQEERSLFKDTIVTPTFIDDIAQVVKRAVNYQIVGLYHMTGSTYISPYNFARRAAKIFGFDDANITAGSFKAYLKIDPRPRQQYLAISNQKLESYLGFKMSSLDIALKMIKWQMGGI
ncbi:MAG: SDR family oxidoreductase [bacterium]|nr:SDR family oxidoreductase [bacterium]